jgi:hypothetical protein
LFLFLFAAVSLVLFPVFFPQHRLQTAIEEREKLNDSLTHFKENFEKEVSQRVFREISELCAHSSSPSSLPTPPLSLPLNLSFTSSSPLHLGPLFLGGGGGEKGGGGGGQLQLLTSSLSSIPHLNSSPSLLSFTSTNSPRERERGSISTPPTPKRHNNTTNAAMMTKKRSPSLGSAEDALRAQNSRS